ncbi:MAG: sodium-translocating pyrophosphatase [Candidatus Bathyarchaeia archaeon]|jgi:K(+)-stimulated pyrophosphate-energized sodium pump
MSFEALVPWAIIGIAIISLLYAWWLRGGVLKKDKGTAKMQEVWNSIRVGADAYLNRQLRTILPLIAVLAVALFFSVYVVQPTSEATEVFGKNAQLIIAVGRMLAFVLGASFSLIVGQYGMRMAVQANVRVASASRRSFNEALSIAYYAGTITGMLTDGLGLLGGTSIFIIFGKAAPDALLGFGFGGTLLALFMRVGGGIYTKAADVGADLVGKIEKDIPEDDPRNAAVVADLVGDNVGDCAGMAADIFESYEVTIVSALILGLAVLAFDPQHRLMWILIPLIVRGIGVISSILGTFTVPIWTRFPIKFLRAHNAEDAMFRSYEVSSINTVFWAFVVAWFYGNDWRLGALVAIGVGLAVSFNPLTSYFTATNKNPVKEIVKATEAGPATTILSGLASGFESSVWALLYIVISFVLAILLFPPENGSVYTLYAIAMIGIGMLSHTGNNVAMDSYGPISDNANGIGQMAWGQLDDEETRQGRQVMADLDSVGNTTKAITKGIAIASAVIAAVSLFASYITATGLQAISVSDIRVFIGLLLGGALPWLFSSLNIRAVSRAAKMIVEEVRRQFRIPGVMEGRVPPDYREVVGISTAAAQKELIPLAVIALSIPITVGLLLGVEALGGFLAGIIVSGQLLAVFMANTGGAWDNAKKTIEDEPRDLAANTGKGSDRHKASVVGDTVGDPLKDTAGPALNPMIKVVNLVSLIIAPIIVAAKMSWATSVVALLLIAAASWALWRSKHEVILREKARSGRSDVPVSNS